MGDDLRQRLRDALAAAFGPSGDCNGSNPLHCECGPHAGVSARLDRLADAAMAVQVEELERLRQVIDRHDYGLMPVCEGYMASRAEHAERELKAERERAEAAEAAIARTGERLDALIAAGFGAVTDTLRELRAALDCQEADRGSA